MSKPLFAFQTPREDGSYLTLSEEATRDEMQISGAWIECNKTVMVEQ